ncbi:MAG TPA: hypothetical protein VLA56_21105 [Pseudomonadales bacterium]|nr:hypothetical protein [Pseudomonadales bacterium]
MSTISNCRTLCRAALLMLFGGLFLTAQAAGPKAHKYEQRFSGTSVQGNHDVDGDGNTGGVSDSGGTGTFGASDSRGINELAPWDGASFCSATEIRQEYIASVSTARFASGDQLASELDSSPPSFLCFDFTTGVFRFEIHQVFSGGTGRFEGASGATTITGSGRNLGVDSMGRPLQSIFSGTSVGTVELQH